MAKRKVMIIIRDGWGEDHENKGDAPYHAKTPNIDSYKKDYPSTIIRCTGNDVGNPDGVQGGSEVGHLTIGAGRIVWQPYELINQEIKNGGFFKNEKLLGAIEHCKKNNSNLHLNGLFSDQGIHADLRHMFSILDLCKQESFDRVYIHLCLDGRDVPEKSAQGFIDMLNKKIDEVGICKIASMAGRYYTMDRDKNWDRVRKAYDSMVDCSGFKAKTATQGLSDAYDRGDKTDYYVQPTVIVGADEEPIARLKDNDAFIWYNFRSDRSKEITAMINGLDFCKELPEKLLSNLFYVCFSVYDEEWTLPVAFPQEKVQNNLGQIISKNNLLQLRIAETEKYAHVTFFFNSQIDEPNPGEERIMVNSPKVASYDQKPEMSAYEVTEKILPEIESEKFDFIVLNFANPDLVGHSGVFEAAVKACEVVDECVGKVVSKGLEEGYVMLVMADHGNADHMFYDNGEADPSHGLNPIRCFLISDEDELKQVKLKEGKGMKDIAPTVLDLMGVEQPVEMTGESLIEK